MHPSRLHDVLLCALLRNRNRGKKKKKTHKRVMRKTVAVCRRSLTTAMAFFEGLTEAAVRGVLPVELGCSLVV
jgi:hypothetical protein